MTKLSRSILMLIVYLTIFFNLERVDLGVANIIDISSVVYIMTLLVLIAIFMFPAINRIRAVPILTIWAGFYLLVRLSLLSIYDRPIWGGIYMYLTVTEISLSAIAIYLARDVCRYLDDFNQAVENITLSGLSHRVQHKNEAYEEIQKEILRSRRRHYPITAMVIAPDAESVNLELNRSVLEIQKMMMSRYALTNIIRLASNLIRRTDMIVDQAIDQDSFVIVLPDTKASDAEKLGERFKELVKNTMGIRIEYGLATFPEDALTFDDLILQADKQIQSGEKAKEDGTPASQ